MIAAKVVMEARAAGIQIEAQGDDLLLKGDAQFLQQNRDFLAVRGWPVM